MILLIISYYSALTFFVYFNGLSFLISQHEFTLVRFLIGMVLSVLGVGLINLKNGDKAKISSLFFVFQLSLVLIPSTVFVALQSSFSFWISFFILICLYLIFYFIRIDTALLKFYTRKVILGKDVKLFLLTPLILWFIFCFLIVLSLFVRRGVSFSNVLNLDLLYSFREDVFNSYKTVEFISIYGLAYFLLPLMLLYSITNKKIIFTSIVLSINLCLFLLTGMKTYFFMPFFTVFVYYLLRNKTEFYLFKNLIISIILICVFTYFFGKYIESEYPTAMFLRSVFEPARLHIIWIDFFYDKTKIPFWILNPSGHPDFSGLGWEEVIAKNLGGTVGNGEGANTGIISSSFSVYGISGLVIHIIFLSLILSFLNAGYAKGTNTWIPAASIPAVFLLTNISFVGAFFYFGLLFATLATLCLGALIKDKSAKGHTKTI